MNKRDYNDADNEAIVKAIEANTEALKNHTEALKVAGSDVTRLLTEIKFSIQKFI